MVQSLSERSNFHSSNNNMVVSLIFEQDPLLSYLINFSWICLWNNLIICILQRLILQTQIKITKSLSLEENPIPKSIKRKAIIKPNKEGNFQPYKEKLERERETTAIVFLFYNLIKLARLLLSFINVFWLWCRV